MRGAGIFWGKEKTYKREKLCKPTPGLGGNWRLRERAELLRFRGKISEFSCVLINL